MALEAASGKLVWCSFGTTMVHHDIWHYDMPAEPVLITAQRDGEEIPAVAQVTKMGFVFILDRVYEKPLFSSEERPVPQSDVPGEATWPTQPFAAKLPAVVRPSLTEADVSDITPESYRDCMKMFHSLDNHGMYTPYGRKMTLVMPGTFGRRKLVWGVFRSRFGLFICERQ